MEKIKNFENAKQALDTFKELPSEVQKEVLIMAKIVLDRKKGFDTPYYQYKFPSAQMTSFEFFCKGLTDGELQDFLAYLVHERQVKSVSNFFSYVLLLMAAAWMAYGSIGFVVSAAEKNVLLTGLWEFVGPLINVFYLHYLIEGKTLKKRIFLAVLSGIGFSLGSMLTIAVGPILALIYLLATTTSFIVSRYLILKMSEFEL